MALRSGYKGFKKLLPGLKLFRPGTLGIDNDELSKSFLSISDQEKLGAFQLLKPVSAFTKTNHSVEFVYDPVTQIITANGKATGGAATIQFMQRYNQEGDKQFISNGEYYLSGGISNDCYLIAGITDNGQYKQIETVGSYPKKIVIDGDDSSNDGAYLQIAIRIAEGVTVNNAKFKPMLSYQPGEFTTHAMTNRELTPAILKASTDFTFDTNGNLITKQGNIAVPYLRVTGVTATANDLDTPVCVVPEECRSQMTKIFPVISSGQVIMATLYTNGKIVVNTSVTSATITIMIPWSILP